MSNIFDLFNKIKINENNTENTAQNFSFIVAGLGNPGEKYMHTRHNIGFLAIDYISQKLNFKVNRIRFNSLSGECIISNKRILFLKPQMYMNNSGEAVRQASDFYKIKTENIIVIFDDISFETGVMRVKRKGSDGGHKGIKSIIEHLGTQNFPRIKIGAGICPPQWDIVDWVLGNIETEKRSDVYKCIEASLPCVELIAAGDIETAMGRYN